jgi:plasmid stabilization system protein ParE
MAKKSIVWTHTVIKQRRQILKYWTIRNKSTAYAEKLINLIKEHIEVISENPKSGKITSHPGTRETAMGNFSIYYKVSSSKIFITAFWDNRQSPKKLMKILSEL